MEHNKPERPVVTTIKRINEQVREIDPLPDIEGPFVIKAKQVIGSVMGVGEIIAMGMLSPAVAKLAMEAEIKHRKFTPIPEITLSYESPLLWEDLCRKVRGCALDARPLRGKGTRKMRHKRNRFH